MNAIKSWHVAVAAEAIVAGLLARCGLDVLVQYGADQPEYDLIASRGDQFMKVSVKGSQDGGWGLTQSFLANADYHAAADTWLKRHKPRTVLAFVQFKDVAITDLPRIYLSTPSEVAERLKATAKGRGDTILYEYHKWTGRAYASGTEERIPVKWKFSRELVESLLVPA